MGDRTYVFTLEEWGEWQRTNKSWRGWPYTIVGFYDVGGNSVIVIDVWEQIADEESLEEIRIWRIRHGNR